MDNKPFTVAVYMNRPSEKWLFDKAYDNLDAINIVQSQKHWIDLKILFETNNCILTTWSNVIENDLKPDYVLFVDIPLIPIFLIKLLSNKQFSPILFLSEPPSIRFWGYWKILQSQFRLVFDWSSPEGDTDSRVRLPHPACFDFHNKKPFELKHKSKFATMITANKPSNHSKSLQKHREHVIKWFNNNHSQNFDLFGAEWDVSVSKYRAIRFIRKMLNISENNSTSVRHVYRGTVENKWDTMSAYKFVFTFENSGYPNLITEKIFDAIYAGSVPIYFGAPNITDYINSSLFIDYKDFENMENLYDYLINLTDDAYLSYIESGKSFFESLEYHRFSSEHFSEVVFGRLQVLNEST